MFVDASAIVSILVGEDDAIDLEQRVAASARMLVSAIVIYEATLAVARELSISLVEADAAVRRFMKDNGATIVSIGAAEAAAALDAHVRFGKGRHPARLNMGDCFAYACARANGAKLLYKGADFALTDIEAA